MSIKRFINTLSYSEIERIVRSPVTQRFTRYYLLHEDETIKQEITEWVTPSGSLEKKNESGQSRSVSLSLRNEKSLMTVGYKGGIPQKEYKYIWTPVPNRGGLWDYNKIKIVTELKSGNETFEISEGIFVFADQNLNLQNGQHTVSVQCYDKFALLDGTIGGNGEFDYEIPLKTPIFEALSSLLKLDKGNGYPYDLNQIHFPVKYMDERTPYTLKKTNENSIGSIIKDLVLMISCDVRYDDYGTMVILDSLADKDYYYRNLAWTYLPDEFKSPSLNLNKTKIKNKITVVGTNINGVLCKGEAVNDNPQSNYNINSAFGIKSQKITDDLIYSNMLCKERARYELKKNAQNYANIQFTSNYIPHLEPGDLVRWTYEPWEISQEDLLVNTVSIPLNNKDLMPISCTNLKELPL